MACSDTGVHGLFFALLLILAGTAPAWGQGAGHGGHQPAATMGAREAAARLTVSAVPAVLTGRPVKLRLTLHDLEGKPFPKLEVVHEKQVHLIIVRDALDRFAHLHPPIDDTGAMTIEFTFPSPGRYRIFADFQPAGMAQSTAMAELVVPGTAPAAAQLAPNVPGRVEADGLVADVAVSAIPGGGGRRIAFGLSDPSGQPVTDLAPYLGAQGHLVVLDAAGKDYVHAHPEERTSDGRVSFLVDVRRPGLYKGWGQFLRGGLVRIIPFVVKVDATL